MRKSELRIAVIIVASSLLLGACSAIESLQSPDDKAITTAVQSKLYDDSVLKTRDIQVASEKGVVTLTGTVGTDLEKSAAERLANSVKGVRNVVNQLAVGSAAMPATQAAAAPPQQPETTAAAEPAPEPPRATRHRRASTARRAESVDAAPQAAQAAPQPEPATTAAAAPAAPAPAPAPPPPQRITVPAGTVLTVRMIDGIDSTRNRPGEEFAATLDAPLVVGDRVLAQRGSDARVRLVQARSAGRMTGSSQLQVEMVSVAVAGNSYPLESSVIEKQGASRGKRTAETVGGGAGLGALIGAIAGKGKGAAIGAAIGAGAGTAVQASTHGEVVKIPSETKLDFTLKTPLTITLPQ